MNTGLQEFHAMATPWTLTASHPGVSIQANTEHLPQNIPVKSEDGKSQTTHHKSEYIVLNSIGSTELAGRQISLLARHARD